MGGKRTSARIATEHDTAPANHFLRFRGVVRSRDPLEEQEASAMIFALALSVATGPVHIPHSPGRVPPAGSKECPAEELSCGKQRPVRSDGVHRFVNRDMGL